ncbi:hypothetical protein [Legionella resiliens]|uniref:Uncharacterized protein n=1 Tax=Legionella resiliens TaxID=2905958 RepID=A0ABS8WWR6_9GAMM|nr:MULTISPECIES: hypothetical protein [unclassified Legionella]MCE0721764.1 hypothetical protein [Legionella sp. 9fVS26]MCE3530918.1 hypothetical protein [Legionella sp. 8cVS16]
METNNIRFANPRTTKSSTFEMELRDFTESFAYVDKETSLRNADFIPEQNETPTLT